MIVLVMGVAGAGKSTVGAALARALAARFIEGDALHPGRNLDKMKRGKALTDADRKPWLAGLRRALDAAAEQGDVVVACSALKRAYRKVLLDGHTAQVVWLDADPDLLRRRLQARRGHFFGVELLESQLDTLEEPKRALRIDASRTVEEIVAELKGRFAPEPAAVDGPGLRALVRRRLLALAGVSERKSKFSGAVAFFAGGKEFAHFHHDTEMDVRVPRALQKKLKGDPRVAFRPRASDWIEFRYASAADIDLLVELASASVRP